MSVPRITMLALLSCISLAGCEANPTPLTGTGGSASATIRLVNATSQRLDVVTGGVVATGNGNLGFGASSSCFGFDPSNPDFSIRVTGTATSLPYTLTGTVVGGSYTVLAANNFGAVQLTTLDWNDSPASGRSGLRVFDGVALVGNFDVYLTPPATTQSSLIFRNSAFGVMTPFLDSPAGGTLVQFTNAGTTDVVFDTGTQTLAADKSYVLVAAVPSSFLTTKC